MSKDKDSYRTLEALLEEYCSAEKLASDLDRAMLSMVLLLRHEPESRDYLIKSYESLYELRKLILNQAA